MKHAPRLIAAIALLASPARAEAPAITAVSATEQGGSWRFDVTLTHPDSGWQHYADGWEVLDADGNVLGHRTLAHPHGFNQPFTRALGGVTIPEGTQIVYVRAHCLTDGWGAELFPVRLAE